MPQFDFVHVFWPQVSWLALCFLVLYFGIVKLTLPKLGIVMDAREGRISSDVEAARAARDAANQTEAHYLADLVKARAASRHEIEHAKHHAEHASASQLAVAHEATDGLIHAAEGRIAKAVATAEASLREVIADAAQAVVKHVTGAEPALDSVNALIDSREKACGV